MASLVYFQFTFSAITLILLAGSVLGRMNIRAWMAFMPLWLIFSYTVGAFSLWGGGFLYHWGVIDYSGGYVIHLSSGIAGLTAAYWTFMTGNKIGTGWTEAKERQRTIPPEQCSADAGRCRAIMDGMIGIQRRSSVCCEYQLFDSSAQHKRLRGHKSSCLDISRRHLLRETFSDRSSSGNDDRPRLHHSGSSDGKAFGQRSMGVDDDSSQEMQLATAGGT
ncbi:hypothetical protein V6N11_082823 [Hibiscus sabdariffa]|uniref:Ammonium transporter AmtB-like domain-containing protein n=1 Tax=Hibiscus sabdariffa TaxID=183260 RepID=A0ABR2QK30_9ROSI